MTVMDTLWGASLFALTTFIAYKIKELCNYDEYNPSI